MSAKVIDEEKFDWVQLKKDIGSPHIKNDETFTEKFKRKFNENPLVPVGCLATTAALTFGLISFRKGDQKTSQLMMRFRIGAQGFTVVALLVGIYSAATKTASET